MKYKGYKIYANAKSYSLWTIDEAGRLDELEHDFEGYDVISYTFCNDEILDGEYGDFETVEELKNFIDKMETKA